MELQELWHKANEGQPTDELNRLLHNQSFMHSRSTTPLQKLKMNLAMGMVMGVIITLGYGLLIFYFPYWQVQLGLLIVSAFNILIMLASYRLYNSIDPTLSQGNVLQTLKMHHQQFTAWFKQQLRMAVFIYPVAAAAGFMLGGAVGSGKDVGAFLSKPFVWVALAICVAVLVPLGLLLAKYMNRKAFGRYVDELKEHIDELERG